MQKSILPHLTPGMPRPFFARITSLEEEKRNSARKQFDLELSAKPPVMLIIAKSDKSHGSVTLLLENTVTAKSLESGNCKEQLIHQGSGYHTVYNPFALN